MAQTILFVSHKERQCGVHEFGKNVARTISRSSRYKIIYVECSNPEELDAAVTHVDPRAVIYNYYPSTMPWMQKKIIGKLFKPLNRNVHVPQIAIMHEVTQQKADEADNYLFDFYIAPDPTLLLKNPIVFKTGRLVPEYHHQFSGPDIPTVGSFGFATPNKGFERVVEAVDAEFDEAVIRFNIPSADFGDKSGSKARALAERCRGLITKPGIQLIVSYEFLSQEKVLDFLSQNTINVFLYEDKSGRGISSATDYALAVGRPLAVSDSSMFRNLFVVKPSIIFGSGKSLKEIINQDQSALKALKNEWDDTHLIWEYDRILHRVLNHPMARRPSAGITGTIRQAVKKYAGTSNRSFTWLRNTHAATEDDLSVVKNTNYEIINLPARASLNRILDHQARILYAPAIEKMQSLVPLTMAKKIPEANVQQAFVFDTVLRFRKEFRDARILCVGSYEDTAAMSLARLGVHIDEIDPVLNYYLQEFISRPGVQKNSYDIIFSTSVIEHDPDDESFARCVSDLLKQDGVAILTCDYNDQWKPGDLKPGVDARLYTKADLTDRLPAVMQGCVPVDVPQWECPHPDFVYLNKYRYTFATFVVRKVIR